MCTELSPAVLPSGTNWPDLHWDLNLQQTYYLLLTANRLDISTSESHTNP